MAANGANSNEDTEIAECDGEKVVTMMDVLQEQQDFEDDANAVLGASDDKNCTYLKGYVKRQAIYACLTCCPDVKNDESKRAGVCLACSLNCHENHDLVELYTKRNFRCDCGNPKFNSHPCQYTANKTDLNDNNNYNQNFAGIYCICHRPYPDPEALEEDEMIQCIICEDWLHSAHLESVVPPADQYAEMVCKDCMKKNEFLQDYCDIAVITDNFEVDIVSTNPEPSIISVTTITNDDKELFTDDKELEQNGQTTDVEMINDNLELSDEKVLKNIEAVLENKSSEENPLKDTEKAKTEMPLEENKVENMRDVSMDQEPTENKDLLNSEDDTSKKSEDNIEEETKAHEEISNINEEDQTGQAQGVDNTPKDIELNENGSTEKVNSSNFSDNDTRDNQQDKEMGLNAIEDEVSSPKVDNNLGKINESQHKTDKQVSEEINNMTESDNIGLEDGVNAIDKRNSDINDVETSEELNKMIKDNDIGNTEHDEKDKTELETSEELIIGNTEHDEKDKTELETSGELIKTNDIQVTKEMEQVDSDVTSKGDSDNISINGNSEELPNEFNDNVPTETNYQNNEATSNKSDNATGAHINNISLAAEEPSNTCMNDSHHDIQDKEMDVSNLEGIDSDKSNIENQSDHSSIDKEETSTNIEDRSVQNGSTLNGGGMKDHKRKFDDENESEAKKLKFDTFSSRREGCTRPIKSKITLKGSTFWPSNFRQKLCTCSECITMYKDLSVLFLIDPEDTVTAYEMLGQEKTQSSQYERGLAALSSLDRVQQINALTEYNKMRDKLLDFLKSFKDRKEIVKEDDIKAFFAGMKPKREPDGVYFCR